MDKSRKKCDFFARREIQANARKSRNQPTNQMKIYIALTITALLSTPLAVFADAGTDAAEKALVENSEPIEQQVASLNLELAKFTKILKDEATPLEEKAAVIKKMCVAFAFGFPDDCEELVQTLSNILKDKETAEGTKKWILQMFSTMGAKASKAESAIEHCLENSKQYRDKATLAMAFVAPKNVLFQKRMNDILVNPDLSADRKDDAVYRLVIAGRWDDKILNFILSEAERRGLRAEELLLIAQHAEKLAEADRKRFLDLVKEPTTKSYEDSVTNYFRETLMGNTSKAMAHYAESLTFGGDSSLAVGFSLMHLNRLKKSEIKLLAPVLIDLMKKDGSLKSIAYLLSDVQK